MNFAFVPGTLDTRELGVRVYRVAVDGQDVTERVLWDRPPTAGGEGPGRFRWTRPSGMLLVPVDRKDDAPVRLRLRVGRDDQGGGADLDRRVGAQGRA